MKNKLSTLVLASTFAISIPVHSGIWDDPNASWNTGNQDSNDAYFGSDQSLDVGTCSYQERSNICMEGMISEGLDPLDCPLVTYYETCD